MRTSLLGRTGLEVGALGLGGLFLSNVGGNDDAAVRRIVRRAVELGVTFIDTAPTYGDSELKLGAALEHINQPVILSTKIGGRPEPFQPKDAKGLHKSVEMSLKSLRRDYIDVLLIHEPDRPQYYDWWDDYEHFHGPVNEVLENLKERGLIRFTGLGGTTAYELVNIVATDRYDVILTAYNYSLLWQEAGLVLLPEAAKRHLGIIAGSPLQQGALAKRHDEAVRTGAKWMSPPRRAQFLELYSVLDDLRCSLPELAIRYVISNPLINVTLSGARSVEELEANVRAVEKGPLGQDILAKMDEIASMVPFRPYEEPFNLPFSRPYRGPGRSHPERRVT